MYVMGYFDKWSARRGEKLELKVSTTEPKYRLDIVRLNRYFNQPDLGRDVLVEAEVNGTHTGRLQEIAIGSYAVVPSLGGRQFTDGLTFHCWVYLGAVHRETGQGIVTFWDSSIDEGVRLCVGSNEHLQLEIKHGCNKLLLESATPLRPDHWYAVAVRVDPRIDEARLDVVTCKRRWLSSERSSVTSSFGGIKLSTGGDFIFGAKELVPRSNGVNQPSGGLNGKLDRPTLWGHPLSDSELDVLLEDPSQDVLVEGAIARWDFSKGVSNSVIADISGNNHHGHTVNMPMRAVTGANWDGTAVFYNQEPSQYGAIYFHEDDLEDCQWDTDIVIDVGADWRSGVYAARLVAGDFVDYVPFYVRPAENEAKSKVLFLAPTNTYLAYGNEKQFQVIWTNPEFVEKSTDVEVEVKPLDRFLLSHPELGSSIYDLHPDGSGVCNSSRLRPLLTMRPQFLHWLHNQARHFPADLYLIEWLETQGIEYDVATDEDLHVQGREVLDEYSAVLTGSHPEYWTYDMLQALEAYLSNGGKMLYLGGNGFYWVTGMSKVAPHFIEVRRGVSGIRAWTSHPGEVQLATTGEPGGLWRNRGQAPNSLSGVGFASEGWGGAPGYVRTPESSDQRVAFIFEGVGDDEIIGDFGFIMGGAAGDEIDRVDTALGSPMETMRLATTELRHTDYYQVVVEDCSYIVPGLGGTEDPRVRSDLTYVEDVNGGAVFSTGSINWIGSLMWNNGNNNVSKITRNVIEAFCDTSRSARSKSA